MCEKGECDFAKYDNIIDGSGTIFCHHILGLGNHWVFRTGVEASTTFLSTYHFPLILVIIDGLDWG